MLVSKSMLSRVQLVVHFKEMAQSLVDEPFQCFHYYAGQADWSVVAGFMLVSFFKDWCDIGTLPVRGNLAQLE